MRVLEAVSAGLSLTGAAIIMSVLVAGGDVQLLFLAALCCVIVALYQIVNFWLQTATGHRSESHYHVYQNRSS